MHWNISEADCNGSAYKMKTFYSPYTMVQKQRRILMILKKVKQKAMVHQKLNYL